MKQVFMALVMMLGMAHLAIAGTVVDSKSTTKVASLGTLTVGSAEWRDQISAAQELNASGSYAKAVKTAPLSYQKASYALNYLRQLMGGKRTGKNWGSYSVEYQTDPKEASFAGTDAEKAACLKQIKAVRVLIAKATEEGYADRVAYIEPYLAKYEDGILR